MLPVMSYEDFLKETKKEDNRESWIDWKTDVCGMSYLAARRAAYDPEWGYEE